MIHNLCRNILDTQIRAFYTQPQRKFLSIVTNDLVTGKGFSLKFERAAVETEIAQRAKQREAELCLKENM
jgi:hypothetical protein